MAEHLASDADARSPRTLQGKRHFVPVDFGKNTSSAASSRARVPGGPAIISGRSRRAQELRIEQEKRQAAEMVAMQMREHEPSIRFGSSCAP